MKDKKVLITGAGGFIGSHLTERLVKDASSVRAFVHYNSRNDHGLLELINPELKKSLEIVSSDITDPVSIYNAMKDIDIVFNLAALIGIPYSYYSPNSYVETNIKGTLNVLNAAKELETEKIIITSTSEVYGTALYTPIDERHPLQAQSPYSATKIAADKLTESYHLSFNMPVTIIRPFNTFGPRQSLRAIIPTIITQAIKGEAISLGNTNTVRDFVYVKDTVNGFIKVATCNANNGRVINIGTGKSVTINELVEIISNILNKNLTILEESQRVRPHKSEVLKLICDASNAKDILKWEPEYTLKEGLDETIKWFETNINNFSKSNNYNL